MNFCHACYSQALVNPFAVLALGGPVDASEDPGAHAPEDPFAVLAQVGLVKASEDPGAHALEDPFAVPALGGLVDASEDPVVTPVFLLLGYCYWKPLEYSLVPY